MNTLDVFGVSKRFGRQAVLHDITFSVAQSEIVALLGPSGCGKTTTLRVIAGFEHPDSGEIRIEGKNVIRKLPFERDFGIVFQDYALFPQMTVRENIAYGIRYRRYRRSPADFRIAEVLRLVKLADYSDRYPHELSGGQKQRIALARSLAPSPAILLLDEPLSALDTAIRAELRIELRRLLKELGTTTLIVTHDQEEAMTIADRVLLMNEGVLIQEGRPLDVYDAPNNRFAAEFLGRCNFLQATIIGNDSDGEIRALLRGGQTFRVRVRSKRSSDMPEIEIGIRPENVFLGTEAQMETRPNIFRGTISEIVSSGGQSEIKVDIGGDELIFLSALRRVAETHSVGEPVILFVDPADIFVW